MGFKKKIGKMERDFLPGPVATEQGAMVLTEKG